MNGNQEHQGLMEEGIWKLCLDKDNIDEVLQSFEQHEVKTAVDLILKASNPSNFCLTHTQALRLKRLVTLRRDSIVWHELFLEVASESPHWQYIVSHIADCFPKISVSMTLSSQQLPLATAFAIHHAVKQDNRLQELSMFHFMLTDDTMEILSQALRSPSTPSLRRLSLSNVDYIPSQEENIMNSHNHPLAVALAGNMTLRRIEIRHCMKSNQGTLFSMMNALVGSTSLEELSLEGLNLVSAIRIEQNDTNLMEPLTQILEDPQCQIRSLDLNVCGVGHFYCQERRPLQSLLSSLEENVTVESIDLSENGLDPFDMAMILDSVKKMPSVRRVDLNDQGDLLEEGSISWLANSCLLEAQPTTRLVELQIDDYLPDIGDFDYDSENSDESDIQKAEIESILLKLLRNNPSLANLGLDVADAKDRLPPSVVRLMDLNLCGRCLLVATLASRKESCGTMSAIDDIPVGLWPIVLERTHTLLSDFPERCADVLYDLLQNGQFLMNR